MARVSLVENDLAGLDAPLLAEQRQPRDLGVIQRGEHQVGLFRGFRHAMNPPDLDRWREALI